MRRSWKSGFIQARGDPGDLNTRRDTLTLAAALACLAAGAVAAEPGVGQVARSSGAVEVVRAGSVLGLTLGDPVFQHDIVRTGPDGRLLIVGGDGLRIALGPGTELAVHAYLEREAGGGFTVVLGLLQGIARLIGGEPAAPRTIEVDTRTAVASVRSTEWLIESTARGTAVLSIVGEVSVLGLAGGSVVLRPGQGTDVPPDGPPKAAATWGEARRRDALARTTP